MPDLAIDGNKISPYVSLYILRQMPSRTQEHEIPPHEIVERVLRSALRKGRGSVKVELLEVIGPDLRPAPGVEDGQADASGEFIVKTTKPPSWFGGDEIVNVDHFFVGWHLRRNLIAINTPDSGINALRDYVRSDPTGRLSEISVEVMEASFATGEAKTFWLNSAISARPTKASSKNLNGPSLEDALSPHEDGTFGYSAVRVAVEEGFDPSDRRSTLGFAPGKSQVWWRKSSSTIDYLTRVDRILDRIHQVSISPLPDSPSFPMLARSVSSLAGVREAFDVTLSPEDSGPFGAVDAARAEAIGLLEQVTFSVVSGSSGADFVMDLTLDERTVGQARCAVSMPRGKVRMAFGHEGEPTDRVAAQGVVAALQYSDLMTAHYESGHSVSERGVWVPANQDAAFSNFKWKDFSGHNIKSEKPALNRAVDIHGAIGAPGDASLFAWVLKEMSTGYLVCDDGSGEVADFVHLSHNDELSLMHVKGSNTDSLTRRVAVQQFEVVVGQAVKNLRNADQGNLLRALSGAPEFMACWLDGKREKNRADFLQLLESRKRSARSRVIVVQPHLTERALLMPSEASRIGLLNVLLNSAHSSAVGMGFEFEVWSSV